MRSKRTYECLSLTSSKNANIWRCEEVSGISLQRRDGSYIVHTSILHPFSLFTRFIHMFYMAFIVISYVIHVFIQLSRSQANCNNLSGIRFILLERRHDVRHSRFTSQASARTVGEKKSDVTSFFERSR